MKTSKNLISILLAVMMVIGMVSTAFAGTIKDNAKGKIDTLISQNSIAEVAEDLITDINNNKKNITGTVLRLVFLFVDDETLAAKIGDKDVTTLTDAELATILVSWLDAKLPELTKDITNQSWYSPLQTILNLNILNPVQLDLSSTRGALNTVYTAMQQKLIVAAIGDVKNLNVDSLKNIKSKSDLDVVYQVLQFLADNTSIIKKVINGNINLGTLLKDQAADLNSNINEALGKDAIKAQLYKLIDGNAEDGDFAKSAYKDYTADQLLAAAFIRMVKNSDAKTDIVSKSDCNDALGLTVYQIISKFSGEAIASYGLLSKLNEAGKKAVEAINNASEVPADIKAKFAYTDITEAETNDIINKMANNGIISQVNHIICLVAKHMLSDAAYKELGLADTDNTVLNENLTKLCRYVLPALSKIDASVFGGVSFAKFTEDAVKNMSLKEMGTGVLKLFFPGWFHFDASSVEAKYVNNANSLAQLAVIALKLTFTNSDWVKFDVPAAKSVDLSNIAGMSDDDCQEAIIKMGAQAAALALNYNSATTHYTIDDSERILGDVDGNGDVSVNDARTVLRAAVKLETLTGTKLTIADMDGNGDISVNDARSVLRTAVKLDKVITTSMTSDDYLNSIVNWALNFVKNVPAVSKDLNLAVDDSKSAYYKINAVLNELVDFSFFKNTGNGEFAFDVEKVIFDGILGNVFEMDAEGLLSTFEVNKSGVYLGEGLVSAAINLVDRIETALFKRVK